MNKVILVGRLTKDVEVRENGDKAVARFSLAVNRPFKNKNGEYEANFPNCVAFGKTADFIDEWFKKGDPIGIAGRIQTGSYENKNGDKVYTTDVVVESAEFVGGKKDRDDHTKGSGKSSRNSKKRDYEDEADEEYERPKRKRRAEPENEEEDDYPF